MTNVLVLPLDVSDAADVSANSELDTLPAANLLEREPLEVWRAAEARFLLHIDLDFGRPVTVNAVALHNHNAGSSARWRLGFDCEPAGLEQPAYRTAWASLYPAGKTTQTGWVGLPSLAQLSTAQRRRFMRIEIDDATNAAFQAGRVAAGEAFQPAVNVGFEAAHGRDAYDRRTVTPLGSTYTAAGLRPRVFELPWDWLTDAERRTLDDIERRIGGAGDVLICMNPADAEQLHELTAICTVVRWGRSTARDTWTPDGKPMWSRRIEAMERV